MASAEQEIVDAHMHLWTPGTHPWVAKVAGGGHPAGSFENITTYLLEDYKRDIAGYRVVQSVHVEAAWPGDPVGETDWLEGIANGDSSGIPHVIVGHCDLSSPNVEEILSRHCQSKRFRGIRHLLNFHPDKPVYCEAAHDNYLTDPQWQKGFAALEKYGLSFELHVLPHQAHRAVEVIRKYPGVKVIVDHCCLPYERDEATMKTWREGLEELAACPNVYCKVSGVFCTDSNWNQTSVEGVVKPCLDVFGIERCVFASNFPVDKVNGTFAQLVESLWTILQSYSAKERDMFFAGNAKKFYRI